MSPGLLFRPPGFGPLSCGRFILSAFRLAARRAVPASSGAESGRSRMERRGRQWVSKLAATVLVGVCVGCASTAVLDPKITWKVNDEEVHAGDRRAIVKLARLVGFPNIRQVSTLSPLPAGGWYVLLQSDISVDANRRTWFELQVCEADRDLGCKYAASGTRLVRVGRWSTSRAAIRQEDRWRITDGSWHVEVRLESTSYENAVRIVLAIKRQTLVDRLPGGQAVAVRRLFPGPIGVPAMDPSDILAVRKSRSTDRGYEVDIGTGLGGLILHIREVDDRFELYDVGRWIV